MSGRKNIGDDVALRIGDGGAQFSWNIHVDTCYLFVFLLWIHGFGKWNRLQVFYTNIIRYAREVILFHETEFLREAKEYLVLDFLNRNNGKGVFCRILDDDTRAELEDIYISIAEKDVKGLNDKVLDLISNAETRNKYVAELLRQKRELEAYDLTALTEDINGDGEVNIADINLIIDKILKIDSI